jgi:ProP effector
VVRRKQMNVYRHNREEIEAVIRMLVDRYPKCFFQNPRLRRPLKKNIAADLERADFPASPDLIAAAVDWYMSHFGYLYGLQAGAKRIDLEGNEVGTVTELEQAAAQRKIKEGLRSVNERNAARTVAALPAAACRLPELRTPPAPPELTGVQEALAAAKAAWSGLGDDSLRVALTSAALGVVIKEAQRVINSLVGDAK